MPNSPRTPHRTIRSPDEIWKSAQGRAAAEGTTVTAVINQALLAYGQGWGHVLGRSFSDYAGVEVPNFVRSVLGDFAEDFDIDGLVDLCRDEINRTLAAHRVRLVGEIFYSQIHPPTEGAYERIREVVEGLDISDRLHEYAR